MYVSPVIEHTEQLFLAFLSSYKGIYVHNIAVIYDPGVFNSKFPAQQNQIWEIWRIMKKAKF